MNPELILITRIDIFPQGGPSAGQVGWATRHQVPGAPGDASPAEQRIVVKIAVSTQAHADRRCVVKLPLEQITLFGVGVDQHQLPVPEEAGQGSTCFIVSNLGPLPLIP